MLPCKINSITGASQQGCRRQEDTSCTAGASKSGSCSLTMSQSMMCKLVCSFLIAMSLVDRSASFTLQRPFAMRQSTVLNSGDAVEKLNLEPIARIAGEVR